MNKLFKILTAALLVTSVSSCLKDDDYNNNIIGNKVDEEARIIELGEFASSAHEKVYALNFVDLDTTLTFLTVRLASNDPAPEDITVTLDTSASIIDDYNAAHGTNFVPFDVALFSVEGTNSPLQVVIPAGSREAKVMIKTNAINFDPSSQYAIGFRIVSVSPGDYTISQNFGTYVTAIGAKNKYDGNYSLRIKTIGWAAYGISENMPETWPENADRTSIGMVTSSATSVRMYDYWGFADYIQVAFTTNNDGATGFGAASPEFFFDPNTDALIDVRNTSPDGRNRQFSLNPAVTDSRYDEATGTIYAAYLLTQQGGTSPRPEVLQIFDTLVYISERP